MDKATKILSFEKPQNVFTSFGDDEFNVLDLIDLYNKCMFQ